MAGLGSAGLGKPGGSNRIIELLLHYKVAIALLLLLALVVIIVSGGGLIYSLFASKTVELPQVTTTSSLPKETSTTLVIIPATTSTTTPPTTSTSTTTLQTTSTTTTEPTTTTLSQYQISFCIAQKIQRLYIRNDSTCIPCKTLRTHYGDMLNNFNLVDCEEKNAREDCNSEMMDYKNDDALKRPGGTDASGPGYPTAVINGIAYVGINPQTLGDLTGCGY